MAQSSHIVTVTDEVALDHASQIPNPERKTTDGLDVWSGTHPDLGPIAIVQGITGACVIIALAGQLLPSL